MMQNMAQRNYMVQAKQNMMQQKETIFLRQHRYLFIRLTTGTVSETGENF
jgi:hypothetical protein